MQAHGTFDVNLQPLESHAKGQDDVNLGRMSIDKTFSGDLQATSQGEMLNILYGEAAWYVALEQVRGVLEGKKGSFVLKHDGVSSPHGDSLRVEILAGSGTGALKGISGEMTIRLEGGKHVYSLEYTM